MLTAAPSRPALDLPPPYRLVALRESGDAFAHACRLAGEAEAEAGTFVWVRRFDLLEFAVVLEPDETLHGARRAFLVGMAALADAIAAHCPPEKSLAFEWPDTIRYDGAFIGGGRLGWPQGCREDETPAWLVFAAQILASRHGAGDSGLTPLSTSLEDEGFFEEGEAVIGSFARHFLRAVHVWESEGFETVGAGYLERLPKRLAGEERTIEANGDLLIRSPGRGVRPERLPLGPALGTPAWLDPATGTVRMSVP